jgi:hypothetical protein
VRLTLCCPGWDAGDPHRVRARATQTNEAGRWAVLLPVLAALPQPLTLLEVGASAGLSLHPDRYAYRGSRAAWPVLSERAH